MLIPHRSRRLDPQKPCANPDRPAPGSPRLLTQNFLSFTVCLPSTDPTYISYVPAVMRDLENIHGAQSEEARPAAARPICTSEQNPSPWKSWPIFWRTSWKLPHPLAPLPATDISSRTS